MNCSFPNPTGVPTDPKLIKQSLWNCGFHVGPGDRRHCFPKHSESVIENSLPRFSFSICGADRFLDVVHRFRKLLFFLYTNCFYVISINAIIVMKGWATSSCSSLISCKISFSRPSRMESLVDTHLLKLLKRNVLLRVNQNHC